MMGIRRILRITVHSLRTHKAHQAEETGSSSMIALESIEKQFNQNTLKSEIATAGIIRDTMPIIDIDTLVVQDATKAAHGVVETRPSSHMPATSLESTIRSSSEHDLAARQLRERKVETCKRVNGIIRSYERNAQFHASSTITIKFEDEEESFIVHEDIIVARASFFKAAVLGSWKESEDRVVHLSDVEPVVFAAYLKFIYECTIDMLAYTICHADELVGDEEDDFSGPWRTKCSQKAMHALMKLYILGDFLGDVDFKNDIIKCTVKGINCDALATKDVAARLVFEATPPDCGLQKIFADILASVLVQEKDVDAVHRLERKYTAAAVVATMKAMQAKRYGEVFPRYLIERLYLESA